MENLSGANNQPLLQKVTRTMMGWSKRCAFITPFPHELSEPVFFLNDRQWLLGDYIYRLYLQLKCRKSTPTQLRMEDPMS